MYASAAARARFVDHSLDSASPSRMLTLLYDRLLLDVARGEKALLEGNHSVASAQLVHAQEIVGALSDALDDSWDGAKGMTSLYNYLLSELMQANVAKDADRVGACRELIEPLRDAWHEAAVTAGSSSPVSAFVGQTA